MDKPKLPSDTVVRIGDRIASMLNEIAVFFKPGIKITFLARVTGNPEGDMLISNDDLGEIRAALQRSETREAINLS
jgi:hypothetical protein